MSLANRVRAAVLSFLDDSSALQQTGSTRDGMGLTMSPAAARQLAAQRQRQGLMAEQARAAMPTTGTTTPGATSPPGMASPPVLGPSRTPDSEIDEAAIAAARQRLEMLAEDEQAQLMRARLGPGMVQGNWAGLAALPTNPAARGGPATQPGFKAQRRVPALAWLPRDPKQPKG